MSGLAIITEACIGTKDRACVDVCPVQCIYEFDPAHDVLFSEKLSWKFCLVSSSGTARPSRPCAGIAPGHGTAGRRPR